MKIKIVAITTPAKSLIIYIPHTMYNNVCFFVDINYSIQKITVAFI